MRIRLLLPDTLQEGLMNGKRCERYVKDHTGALSAIGSRIGSKVLMLSAESQRHYMCDYA